LKVHVNQFRPLQSGDFRQGQAGQRANGNKGASHFEQRRAFKASGNYGVFKVETITRLANALKIEIYELFIVPLSPAMEMKRSHEVIIADLKDIVKEAIDEAFEQGRKRRKKRK
jgi:hypothetical protein